MNGVACMLQSPYLFIWVLWTPLLLFEDLPELLLTSTTLQQQPRNKQICQKRWILRNYSRLATRVGRGHTAAGWLWLAPRDASTNCRPAQRADQDSTPPSLPLHKQDHRLLKRQRRVRSGVRGTEGQERRSAFSYSFRLMQA